MNREPHKLYDLQEIIGKGTYATVHKAKSVVTGQIVAIKVMNILRVSDEDLSAALNEIRILSSINNPYVVQYYESFIEKSQGQLWIVMELLEGGDLSKLIEKNIKTRSFPTERMIWSFFIQALLGLKALHNLNIIHRDLKPGNIYLTKDRQNIKIGDMNVSKVVEYHFAKSLIGSPAYLAPEVWLMEPYTNTCDIFSLGCFIYEYASLQLPFDGTTMIELKNDILGQRQVKLPSKYSAQLNSIISKCLIKSPVKRPTAEQLLEDPVVKEKMHQLKIDQKNIDYVSNKLVQQIQVPKNRNMMDIQLPRREINPNTDAGAESKEVQTIYFKSLQDEMKSKKASYVDPFSSKKKEDDINLKNYFTVNLSNPIPTRRATDAQKPSTTSPAPQIAPPLSPMPARQPSSLHARNASPIHVPKALTPQSKPTSSTVEKPIAAPQETKRQIQALPIKTSPRSSSLFNSMFEKTSVDNKAKARVSKPEPPTNSQYSSQIISPSSIPKSKPINVSARKVPTPVTSAKSQIKTPGLLKKSDLPTAKTATPGKFIGKATVTKSPIKKKV